MKLTPWFPGHIKPVRVGVYQREAGYSYWDGELWLVYSDNPESAARSIAVSIYQHDAWRGLAKEQQ